MNCSTLAILVAASLLPQLALAYDLCGVVVRDRGGNLVLAEDDTLGIQWRLYPTTEQIRAALEDLEQEYSRICIKAEFNTLRGGLVLDSISDIRSVSSRHTLLNKN